MKTALNPKNTTIIDDGQFRYPVATEALKAWETANGKITPNNYEAFCGAVDHLMPGVIPGSAEMIEECEALSDAGAPVYRPA